MAGTVVVDVSASSLRASTSGGAAPWEIALQQIVASFTGPVALAVSIIAIVCAGMVLVWGGDMGDFARRLVLAILGIGVVGFASAIVSTFFGLTAAAIF